jgi:hypothetical protein
VPTRYHPLGWTGADVPGIAAKLLPPGASEMRVPRAAPGGPPDDCRSCHGDDLAGGTSGVSCADCHASEGFADWTTDCTFCQPDLHVNAEVDVALPAGMTFDDTGADTVSFR